MFVRVQGLAILLVVPALILQFALRPYWDKRVDLLDCVCCLSILLHLEANVYFNNAEYARTAWPPSCYVVQPLARNHATCDHLQPATRPHPP